MNATIPYSRLQENLQWTCDRACHEHEPILVERGEGRNVVLLSERDYASLVETAYLMRSSTNAWRLTEAMHRSRSEQIAFTDTDELKSAVGL